MRYVTTITIELQLMKLWVETGNSTGDRLNIPFLFIHFTSQFFISASPWPITEMLLKL